MNKKLLYIWLMLCLALPLLEAQPAQPIRRFLQQPSMKGASFACLVQEVNGGEIRFSYEEERVLTPASVLKAVTTATALERLGADYRFPTTIQQDGTVNNGVLNGNLYIKGSGDPSLGSSHLPAAERDFLPRWIESIRAAGIRRIKGAVLADESVFDTEGVSPKWMQEDLGSYFGAGSYGLAVFDNLYRLYLKTGQPGSRPVVLHTEPPLPDLHYHNYLTASAVRTDSSYITGAPFSNERYLYGIIPAGRESFQLKGDLPDPALFLAEYLTDQLQKAGITVEGKPSCHRIASEAGNWPTGKRKELLTTYSPPLRELVRITNGASHNLYADALLKAIGLDYKAAPGEVVSSFERGVRVVQAHWQHKGIETAALSHTDGSGLSPTDKLSARFLTDVLIYMYSRSTEAEAFTASLPQAGQEGSVRNFLKGSELQGKARLKSGSMNRVKAYAGYIKKGDKTYAVTLLVNNYTGEGRAMTRSIEQLLLSLF